MKKLLLLVTALILGGVNCAWAQINTDAKGRKQYVWDFGIEAKAGGATYYLQATDNNCQYTEETNYGTSGTKDKSIAKVSIYSTRAIHSASSPGGKGAGAVISASGDDYGYIEFYAPVSGNVTMVGTYLANFTIMNATASTTVYGNSNTTLSVTAGDRIKIYNNKTGEDGNAGGIEKVVLTETYYGEEITSPSISVTSGTATITPGVASWTAGNVRTSVTNTSGIETDIAYTEQTFNPSVTTYYTTDGTTPTSSSTTYSAPFAVGTNSVVKFISISESGGETDVVEKQTNPNAVTSATTWDFANISESLGGYICNNTLYVGSMEDDRTSNKRVRFSATASSPTAVGDNIISFKTGCAGQVIMKMADYGSSEIKVCDETGTQVTGAIFTGETKDGKSQQNISYHAGGTFFKYGTFQTEADKQYFVYATAKENAGIYSIEFQPTNTNTTTPIEDNTTWDFENQKDVLEEYHGFTKDNMFFSDGTTEVYNAGTSRYRVVFGGQGNTSTGANLISFKVPAGVNGKVTVKPSSYNGDVVLYDGTNVLKTFTTADHQKTIDVALSTENETTLYLYTTANITSSQNVGIFSVSWTTEETPTIGADGYATFSSVCALDFSTATDVRGYYATEAGTNTVKMTEITGTAAAGEGIFLQKTGESPVIPIVLSGDALTGNLLKPTTGSNIYDSGKAQYVFAKQSEELGFYKVTASLAPAAGKAYLETASDFAASRLRFVFEDEETTGIMSTERKTQADRSFYNLSGQRVTQPRRGLYIVGGKKVIIK